MSIDYGQANFAVAHALVDGLVGRGLRHAVVCPGSRSTPLAVALLGHPGLTVRVLIDERSAAYFALGMAKQLARPVAILSTSGTAAANFLPAVVEASLSRAPLVVITADRPPELRDWGAAQTIDQIRLFGSHAKWFVDLPAPDGDPALVRHARATAARAMETAVESPAGPVHVNAPFREPLLTVAVDKLLQRDASVRPQPVESNDPTVHSLAAMRAEAPAISRFAADIAGEPRGVIVCGPDEAPGLPAAVSELSAASGYPVLADPLSGVRFGRHDRSHVIDSYDAFLRDNLTAESLAPEIVIRVGAIPTSKPLQQFLAANPGRRHYIVDPGPPRDPGHLATDVVPADPVAALTLVAGCVRRRGNQPDGRWSERWLSIDRRARVAIDASLADIDEIFEGRALAEVVAALPDGGTLMVGNSMPVRDLDTFARGDCRALRLIANRGANGIDGVASSALGAAAVAEGPVALVVGDLSFYHDMNGLLAARRLGLSATIVVLNNDGGGIFSFLPQAEQLPTEAFEALFGTPIDIDVERVAQLYGADFARPTCWTSYRLAIESALAREGLSIVEVRTDRQRNVVLHRAVNASVAAALGKARGIVA